MTSHSNLSSEIGKFYITKTSEIYKVRTGTLGVVSASGETIYRVPGNPGSVYVTPDCDVTDEAYPCVISAIINESDVYELRSISRFGSSPIRVSVYKDYMGRDCVSLKPPYKDFVINSTEPKISQEWTCDWCSTLNENDKHKLECRNCGAAKRERK